MVGLFMYKFRLPKFNMPAAPLHTEKSLYGPFNPDSIEIHKINNCKIYTYGY